MKEYRLALHIFRRDLRLEDNTALIEVLSKAEKVIPCFIFDTRQVGTNPYKSDNAIQFMINSLQELDCELKRKGSRLYLFYGVAEKIVAKLLSSLDIDLVVVNEDYTPFSKRRDSKIRSVCRRKKVVFESFHDALLCSPEDLAKSDGKPYTIYTPFLRRARNFKPDSPQKNSYKNYYKQKIASEAGVKVFNKVLGEKNPDILVKGGRREGQKLLRGIGKFSSYKKLRDYPAKGYSTHLSAHNKFGTVSTREVYKAIKAKLSSSHQLVSELYWRDFFTHIAYHFPHVFRGAFYKKYNRLRWRKSKKDFKAWCEGKTGFPIVDAGMRELNVTGYMHNRVRMIVASFLVKDLHLSWRWGEKYFANRLTDYDPAVNNGNWQWCASTGCDAQPYFRIFNPWMQQKKFDKECVYIKKWVPELQPLSPKEIHRLEKEGPPEDVDYPEPMVDHKIEAQRAKEMYARVSKKSIS
jgi:deoxyribodipyrimidine photo-lyase